MMDTQFELVDFSTQTSLDIDSLSSYFSPFTFHLDNRPKEVQNWGDLEMDNVQQRHLSITKEEIPMLSLSNNSSRKTSIDIVPFVSTMDVTAISMDISPVVSMMDVTAISMDIPPDASTVDVTAISMNIPPDASTIDTIPNSTSDEETLYSPVTSSSDMNTPEVPPFMLPLSFAECVKRQLRECKTRECKRRRQLRMEILRRKREQGLISYDMKVRYEQRSEFAMKRVRSCGRFVSEITYKSA